MISVSQYQPQNYWLSCWIWNMLSSITVKMYFGKIFNAVTSSENTLLSSSLQKTYAMTISLCNVTGGVGTLDDNTCRQALAPPSKTTLLSVSFQKQGRKRSTLSTWIFYHNNIGMILRGLLMLGSLCTEIIGSKIAVLDSRFICPSNRQPSVNATAAAEACHDYSQLFLLYFLPQVSTQLRLLTHTYFIYQSEGATWPQHTWNRNTAATLCLLKAKRETLTSRVTALN